MPRTPKTARLEIRLTPQHKRAIESAAARVGLAAGPWILFHVLPLTKEVK